MERNEEPVRDVLVFTPVLRLEPETVQRLMALEFDGALSLLLQRDNPEPVPEDAAPEERRAIGIRNHLHQYRRGRETFLAGRWDSMLVIESDIIPPADTLPRLIACRADVAYGVYQFQGSPCVNVCERYPANPATGELARNVGEPLNYKRRLLRRALREGEIPCSGAGLGCILIRRKVLAAVEFEPAQNGRVHCDTPWTKAVYKAGFSQVAAMTVVCGHKAPDGMVVWPGLDG